MPRLLPHFCTKLPFFCTVLPKNCISLSQSQSRNFFVYIIRHGKSKRVPREVSSLCGRLCSSTGINRPQNWAQNEAQQSFNCKTTTFNISSFPWNKLILSCYLLMSWSLQFNSVANHSSVCPCNINPKSEISVYVLREPTFFSTHQIKMNTHTLTATTPNL